MSSRPALLALACAVVFVPVSLTFAQAADDASNDPPYAGSWSDADNGGTGFGPWTIQIDDGGVGGFAGAYLASASGNSDLSIGSGPDGEAWAVYADGPGTNLVAASREFGAGPMTTGQTFSIAIDTTAIGSSGWVGVALTSGGTSGIDPFDPSGPKFGAFTEEIGVGFPGGFPTWGIWEKGDLPGLGGGSGDDTAFGFTTTGVVVAITLLPADEYRVVITDIETGTDVDMGVRSYSGAPITGFSIYDREADIVLASQYFNNAALTAPACACDWNSDGNLNDQDFFDWVNDYFSQTGPQGQYDFNEDGFENDQDFFDFANCYCSPPIGC